MNTSKIYYYFLVFIVFLGCEKPVEPLPPVEPVLNSIEKSTITTADIVWSKSLEEDFDHYEVYYRLLQDTEFKLYAVVKNKNQNFTTVSGLIPNKEYVFFIRVVNKKGKYSDSKWMSTKTLDDIVSNISLYDPTELTYLSIKLLWSRYSDSDRVDFKRYEIHFSRSENFVPSSQTLYKSLTDVNSTSVAVLNLTERTRYYFKIIVYNAVDKFAISSEKSAQTVNGPPDVINLFEPEDIKITSVKLIWTRSVADDYDHYEVHAFQSNDFKNGPSFEPSVATRMQSKSQLTDTITEVTGLKSRLNYFIKVIVVDKGGLYNTSNVFAVIPNDSKTPDPVTIYDPIEVTATTIKIAWSKSNAIDFFKYDLYLSISPNFDPKLINPINSSQNISDTTFADKNLSPNKTYYYKVRTVNIFNKYSDSQEKAITTKANR